jgi:nicotinate-nucleotide pyrophosphorylase (carboxylating)
MNGTPAEIADAHRWPEGWPAAALDGLLRTALAEDIGNGDVTTAACVPPGIRVRAVVLAKQAGVVAGLPVAARVFGLLSPDVQWRTLAPDGTVVSDPPVRLAEVAGPAAVLLSGERVALNLLQRLSGVATVTRGATQLAAGRAEILDTRKTTPGLRWLQRYAVRVGGGRNHRFGLSDGVLIKDNHAAAAGGVAAAVRSARARAPFGLRIEAECRTREEVAEALSAGADIILLDNMAPAEMRAAVTLIAGRARTEASGGVTLANLAEVAATGVDSISLGMLTHSAPAMDISLEIEWTGSSA